MGHVPLRIRAVAVETAHELVVKPARGHGFEGAHRHVQGARILRPLMVAQQKANWHLRRKLLGKAHAAVALVEGVRTLVDHGCQKA